MTGNPAFNIEILGDNNRGYEANTNNKISFRKTSISDLTEDITFSGQLLVNNIPINGSSQPVVRLSKDDDNYIEIASMKYGDCIMTAPTTPKTGNTGGMSTAGNRQ